MRSSVTFALALFLTDALGAHAATDPAAYTRADAANGGRLYDTFWAEETDFDRDDPGLATYEKFSDFFRCKQ
mgnify:CR=1 FL=1